MIVAFAYMAAALCAALVFHVAARERHEQREGERVFRYPETVVRFVFALATVVPTGGAIAIYWSFGRRPQGLGLVVFFGFFGALLMGFLTTYIYLKRFMISVRGDLLSVRGFRTKVARMSGIRRLVMIEGGRGGQQISAYGEHNAAVMKADSGIQDFWELVALLKKHAKGHGVAYEQRDRWGRWTRGMV